MIDREKPGDVKVAATPDAGGGDSIAKLMKLAGPRPMVPDDVRARVHRAVSAEWRQAYRQRRTRRWGIPFALAALVLLAVMFTDRAPQAPVSPIATVAAVGGRDATGQGAFSAGDSIYSGDVITTLDQGVAVTLKNGFSVRVAPESTVAFDALEELTLVDGQVYADTGRSIYDNRSITIHTGVGSAKDIGTQFAVALVDGDMRVAVREGKVDISSHQASYVAEAGEVFSVDTTGDTDRQQLAAYDSSWDWASDLAPAYDLENRSLLDFLQWVARETGKELVFENDGVRMTAMGIRPNANGVVADLTPIEALEAVLPTTRLAYRVEEQRILIANPSN